MKISQRPWCQTNERVCSHPDDLQSIGSHRISFTSRQQNERRSFPCPKACSLVRGLSAGMCGDHRVRKGRTFIQSSGSSSRARPRSAWSHCNKRVRDGGFLMTRFVQQVASSNWRKQSACEVAEQKYSPTVRGRSRRISCCKGSRLGSSFRAPSISIERVREVPPLERGTISPNRFEEGCRGERGEEKGCSLAFCMLRAPEGKQTRWNDERAKGRKKANRIETSALLQEARHAELSLFLSPFGRLSLKRLRDDDDDDDDRPSCHSVHLNKRHLKRQQRSLHLLEPSPSLRQDVRCVLQYQCMRRTNAAGRMRVGMMPQQCESYARYRCTWRASLRCFWLTRVKRRWKDMR